MEIFIHTENLGNDEIATISQLVEMAGVPNEHMTGVSTVRLEVKSSDDVFIFLLTTTVLESQALNEQIAKVPDGGRRAVCVWPQGATNVPLPQGVSKFAYSVCAWDAETLHRILFGEDFVVMQDPKGNLVQPDDTERNECE